MHLKSDDMPLSSAERHWLPWFGSTGKLTMKWSCWLNRHTYPVVETSFEGIAATRVKLLQVWAATQWGHLQELAGQLEMTQPERNLALFSDKRTAAPDFSELFVIDCQGTVLASTHAPRVGRRDLSAKAVNRGVTQPFLHGPYADPQTEAIGPSTSTFHDQVTLMFYQPVVRDGETLGCVCGRVPNDVIGDLIQREAGHIYPESGDNYLFMVDSHFDPAIAPGTALSRSRFEDDTFSHGENLKSGIHTRWGTVRVSRHTELELRFTDPATGELHPGVRETIRNGSNLFITYPGYSDYRHISVIGKGVTFQLPGSPDRWGMMCEADLEEVYRRRSISVGLMKVYLATLAPPLLINQALAHLTSMSQGMVDGLTAVMLLLSALLFGAFGPKRLASRLGEMTEVIRTIAEGEGNLRQRLDTERLTHDETGDMGRWINSFIDNLDGIVGQVIGAAHQVRHTNETMLSINGQAQQTSAQVSGSIDQMLAGVESQLTEIGRAAATAEEMKRVMDQVVQQARRQFESVSSGTQRIRDVVDTSAKAIQSLDSRTAEIGDIVAVITGITNQTNLLALNAAIEAARAGEHGRGFSVVADEVRALAGRTATAAQDIHEKIEGMQNETREAVGVMERGVEDVDRGLRLAEQASSEDSGLQQMVEQMFAIIKLLEENSQQHGETARSVGEISAQMTGAIDELHVSSGQVRNTANKLQQLVGAFEVTKA